MIKSNRVPTYSYNPDKGQWQVDERTLVREVPLQIWVNGELLVTLHRTPGNEFFLAAGFLYYQGLIDSLEDITARRLVSATDDVRANNPLAADSVRLTIRPPATAISRLTAAAIWTIIAPQVCEKRPDPFLLPPRLIPDLPDKLFSHQQLYESTAGAHAVALLNRDGRILHCEEDVGRTNALDKIVGYCIFNKIDMRSVAALFSGRINLEMAVKIARAGFPLALSISAPTAGAVAVLKQTGMAYVGSLQKKPVTLFCGSL
ncbi:MAG: formate dehydrogenase accessory sulfurtransferase FdhD [Deltaproteobacteria bacterium]|nr:formate dehydrogenase accessory sulfurtransferase FdhD [Deltaproteobacteria bacterium]